MRWARYVGRNTAPTVSWSEPPASPSVSSAAQESLTHTLGSFMEAPSPRHDRQSVYFQPLPLCWGRGDGTEASIHGLVFLVPALTQEPTRLCSTRTEDSPVIQGIPP